MRRGLPDLPDWALTFNFVPAAGLDELADGLALVPGRRLLDLACGMGGPGLIVAERCTAQIIGVDFAFSAVATAAFSAARRKTPGWYVNASGHQIPLRSASVDAAICVDALRFIPGFGLAELRRVIKPGARLGITGWVRPADGEFEGLEDPAAVLREGGFRVLSLVEKPEWIEAQRIVYQAAIDVEMTGETDPAVKQMAEEGRHVLSGLKPDGRFLAIAERVD